VSLISDDYFPMYFIAPGTHTDTHTQTHTQTHTHTHTRLWPFRTSPLWSSGRFLGDQLLSYGQNLTLRFRVDRRDTRLSAEDLVLEGAGLRVAVPLIAQGNAYPNENAQTYVFR